MTSLFFKKCCLPQQSQNMPINNFLSSTNLSQCSRVSKEAYFDSRDIDVVFIKPYQADKWNSYSEGEQSCRSSRNSSAKLFTRKKTIFYTGVLSEEESDTTSHTFSTTNSVYIPTPGNKITKMRTNAFLDWISSCCWRCTPGCQQIPSQNNC